MTVPPVTGADGAVDCAVQCRDVTLEQGARLVLSQVSLNVPAGSFVGLFGPNGAGKTTLLRALAGLVRPQAGQITVLGREAAVGHADVGYMPQSRSPNGELLTGRDLLASAVRGERWGLPWLGREAKAEIDRALDAVGASTLAGRRLKQLSGGERQRLLIAQALLGHPRLLLLDEPLASLDPVRMREVMGQLHAIARERGMTVICSSHDLNPMLGLMDSVLYLARGRALMGAVEKVITTECLSDLYGAPVDVYRAPSGRVLVCADAI